jgi:peptidyl-Lys metalloendopeptidase
MFRPIRWALAGLLVLATTALIAAPRNDLDVRLSAPAPVLRGDVDVVVSVTVTNTARHPVQVLSWQLPSDEAEGVLFKISRDGEAVRYTGALVKRAAPQAADHVRLEPGASLTYEVELSAAYDLSRSGRYTIEYASRGAHGADKSALQSQPLYLWLEGRSGKTSTPAAPQPAIAGTSYSRCTASQMAALPAAVSAASSYANGAVSYLGGSPSATPRYTTWFGSYSRTGWDTAKAHFIAIKGAFDSQPLVLDCGCKKKTTYAYVYSNQPYKIYLCGAFWAAPLTGTDSRAGTLIHEMSHFDVVAGTNDWAYGQSAAKSLAISSPTQALDNADSHEYFAENTPIQP